MDLENDSYINELIINRELSQKTASLYIHNIGLYCQLIGLTPEELITEAINEFDKHPSQRRIRKHLIKWKNYLLEHDYAQSTRKKMFDRIRYFYHEFEIETPTKIRMKAGKEKQITIDDLPTISDLRLALSNTNLRTQAIILLMCSSGLSKIDIRNLTYQDFLVSIENTYKPAVNGVVDIGELTQNLKGLDVVGTWEGYRLKNEDHPVKYITFHTPETTKAILNYLEKDPPKTVNDYLFRYHGKQLRENSFNKYFNILNKRCGFGLVGHESYLASHNFRRRFATLLAENGVDFVRCELLLGHLLPATQRSYYKTLTVETMRTTYLKVLPSLCILEDVETIVLTDDRVKQMEQQNKELTRRMEEMEIYMKNIDDEGTFKKK